MGICRGVAAIQYIEKIIREPDVKVRPAICDEPIQARGIIIRVWTT